MKNLLTIIVSLSLMLAALPGFATDRESLLMVRSSKSFDATLDQLSAAIDFNEYKISRIQRVDVGLTKTGYKTEKYRIVFYGKADEITRLATDYPQLIPFIPLKIVIFAEDKDTIMLAMNPGQLRHLVPVKKLYPTFDRWERDLKKILDSAKE